MSKNPNAIAATVAGAVTIGVQWLLSNYAHETLSDWWKAAVTTFVTSAVLYIGKDGVKGTFTRLLELVKTVWSGNSTTPAV